jgi:hypothetical protein
MSLFLMAALSALAVSLMFLSQTETASSRNYRTMSQARYAGEAGIHKAINYLLGPAYSSTPIAFASYGSTMSPVTCISGCAKTTAGTCDASTPAKAVSTGCVVLVANFPGLSSNYPDGDVATAFSTAAQGTLAANGAGTTANGAAATVSYGAVAILMSMRPVTTYGGGTGVAQTWQIVADGRAGPSMAPATVEVMGTFERNVVPAETFAVFATDSGCGAITYTGNGSTDSYDSTPGKMTLSGGKPVTTDSGGAIGTNGNLSIGGTVDIYGPLSTPRSGVGSCTEGAVTALSSTGGARLHGETIQLPQAKAYSTPNIPPNASTTDVEFKGSLGQLGCTAAVAPSGWMCVVTGNDIMLAPLVSGTPLELRNVKLGSNARITIAGTGSEVLHFNSLSANGTASLAITNTMTTLKLAGKDLGSQPVMDFEGNFSTTAFDPAKFQILYAGDGTIKLRGNNELAATIYAPNAFVDLSSSYDVYGSILAKRYTNSGGAKVHYDTALASKYYTLSNPFMSTFTWKKY